jgi:hypothetical protein
LPLSYAASIILKEVTPSARTPHNSPSRYACVAPIDATASAIAGYLCVQVEPGAREQPHRASVGSSSRHRVG